MIDYCYKKICIGTRIITIIEISESKYKLLESFLNSEMIAFGELIVESFESVISQKTRLEEFHGNAFGIIISYHTTIITNDLLDIGMPNYPDVELNTQEIYDIVLDYRANCQ